MNNQSAAELNNFVVAVKQFTKLLAAEFPRLKGMADAVDTTGNDLRQALNSDETILEVR